MTEKEVMQGLSTQVAKVSCECVEAWVNLTVRLLTTLVGHELPVG